MMDIQDSYMTTCQVVLSKDDACHLEAVRTFFYLSGVTINNTDEENGMIEITGDANTIVDFEKSHLFAYVRPVFNFVCGKKERPSD